MAITFDELLLLVAIDKTPGGIPDPSESRREYVEQVRNIYCRMSGDILFPFTADQVADLAYKHRKTGGPKLKAKIAEAHGTQCFWTHRGKGPCSDEAEGGHILPRSGGHELTVANGIIECRAHNHQRSAMSIEEYLLSSTTTEDQSDADSQVG